MFVGVDAAPHRAGSAPRPERSPGRGCRPSARPPHAGATAPRARLAPDVKCRTGGADSRRSPAFRPAPDSGDRRPSFVPAPARRARGHRNGRHPSACRWNGRRRCSCFRSRRRRRGRGRRCPPADTLGSPPAGPTRTVDRPACRGPSPAARRPAPPPARSRVPHGSDSSDPRMTSCTASGAMPVRSSSPFSAATPRSTAVCDLNIPP